MVWYVNEEGGGMFCTRAEAVIVGLESDCSGVSLSETCRSSATALCLITRLSQTNRRRRSARWDSGGGGTAVCGTAGLDVCHQKVAGSMISAK